MQQQGLQSEEELQSWFIHQFDSFLSAKGRRLVGWDEILEGGLAPNAVLMSWRGVNGGIEAARSQHDVIMTPTSHTYFDYYQSREPGEPLAIGGFLPLDSVYAYEPIPAELEPQYAKHILGAQAQLWTEYMPDGPHVEYMAWPRLSALAEVVWSPRSLRDMADFRRRLPGHLLRLDGLSVNYRRGG
jgi:hexosaminidase